MDPAEHNGKGRVKRPRPGCTAERCWCQWLRFHAQRSSAKLKRDRKPL